MGIETSDTPRDEVRAAYVRAALQLHPDHNCDADAGQKMMELQDAWQRYKADCLRADSKIEGGFVDFGVGCSFADDDDERAARAEVVDAASRGYLHRPELRDSSFARRTFARPRAAAECIVIGGGPAGITAIGWLLARKKNVLWIDDSEFKGGRLADYRDVPANTKVDILAQLGGHDFLPFGLPSSKAMSILERMHATAKPLPAIDPEDPARVGWTGLDVCHDLYAAIADSFIDGSAGPEYRDGTVQAVAGRVHSIRRGGSGATSADTWHVRLEAAPESELEAPSVVLATGAWPESTPESLQPSAWASVLSGDAPPRVLPMSSALDSGQLRQLVHRNDTVGVVGGGHTGLVATMLLREQIGCATKLFIRRPLRVAEWDDEGGGYARWAFRGLKGAAASFAHEHGLVDRTPPNGPVEGPRGCNDIQQDGPQLELHHVDSLGINPAVGRSLDAVIYCLGFSGPKLPRILDSSGQAIRVDAQLGGRLLNGAGEWIPGLYGVGLGFADAEHTSGAPYAEAGFMPFALRARDIAESVGRQR